MWQYAQVVTRDAAVAVREARRIDILFLLFAPVLRIRRAGLRVACVAPHLHDFARHLLIVRHADVPLPVDTETARARTVGMTGILDRVLVDLAVTRRAHRLRDTTLGEH